MFILDTKSTAFADVSQWKKDKLVLKKILEWNKIIIPQPGEGKMQLDKGNREENVSRPSVR